MPPRPDSDGDMLQGTLDMLILQTLVLGPAHGHAIAHAIERRSDQILQVEHGSLYPALYRLAQATPDADTDALLKRYPRAVVGKAMGQTQAITEMDALVAYLQMLGTLVRFGDLPPERLRQ